MLNKGCAIIGAAKCGTSALFYSLSQHPALCASSVKESNWFISSQQAPYPYEWYCSLFKAKPQNTMILEASPNYTRIPVNPTAAFAMKSSPIDWKMVYIVRNPIERIRSEYQHRLVANPNTMPIRQDINPTFLLTSNYNLQLTPYELSFEKSQLLVLSYRDLKENIVGISRKVLEFLELDATVDMVDVGKRNDGDTYKNILLASQFKKMSLPFWENLCLHQRHLPYEKLREFFLVDPRAQGPFLEAERGMEAQYIMTPEQEAWVTDFLKDDLKRFEDRWSIDAWQAG